MSSGGELRKAVAVGAQLLVWRRSPGRPFAPSDMRRIGIGLVSGLLAASCTIGFAALVSGKRAGVEPPPEPEPIAEAPRPQDDVYSHRKLLQTGVARNGAPVYRFVECRHLRKDERKLVQVGISKDGLAILRVKPGDYCVFAQASIRGRAVAAPPAPKAVDASNGPALSTLTANQQYACEKFGAACRVALAIQRAENPTGECQIYHYNTSDGTLDWGYFQINSVHLRRPGLNLRDLLDCKANIDYAYQLYLESGFAPWSTYNSGIYRRFLPRREPDPPIPALADVLTAFQPASPRVNPQR